MEREDIDEDFEYAGECTKCDNLLDMSEAGFCEVCGISFCWGYCGGWHNGKHTCSYCMDRETED